MRRALATLLLLLAACNTTAAPKSERPVVVNAEPEVVIAFTSPTEHARTLVQDLAVRCWLDGVVRGAQMFVMPFTRDIRIVGESEDLLVGHFLAAEGGQARLRLTGTAVTDPEKVRRIRASIDRAVTTGETSCPRAA